MLVFARIVFISSLACGADALGDELSMFVESCNSFNPLGGDTEVIEGVIGGEPLGLITYTTDRTELCHRTGQTMQDLFVRPLDAETGLPEPDHTQKQVASDECGWKVLSDAEWGLTADNWFMLIYTSRAGVNLVTFSNDDEWEDVVPTNQMIPSSETMTMAGEPLSEGFETIQFEAIDIIDLATQAYRVVWSELAFGPNGAIEAQERIWTFDPLDTHFKSHIHPVDPNLFLRVTDDPVNQGIYEFSPETGEDISVVHDQFPDFLMRTWQMPANECEELDLVSDDDDGDEGGCVGVVMSVPSSTVAGSDLLWKARHNNGYWHEILRISYSEPVRVDVAVISHLEEPQSVILATAEGDARLYTMDGRVFSVATDTVGTTGSEVLYFSESNLLAVYYKDLATNNDAVCMVYVSDDDDDDD